MTLDEALVLRHLVAHRQVKRPGGIPDGHFEQDMARLAGLVLRPERALQLGPVPAFNGRQRLARSPHHLMQEQTRRRRLNVPAQFGGGHVNPVADRLLAALPR